MTPGAPIFDACFAAEAERRNLVSGFVAVGEHSCGVDRPRLATDRQEWHEAIFEEFVRIGPPGAGGAKGLGLGLSIVQRSVQILGHPLQLRSCVGRGSVFEITVPCAGQGQEPALPADLGALSDAELAGNFVVIIENDEENRQALGELLRQCGCHVIAASTAHEALRISAEHLRTPDLFISDYQLDDGLDGFEAVRQLRECHDQAVPALLITANTDGALSEIAWQAGVTLLHKPISAVRVLQEIRHALARVRVQGTECSVRRYAEHETVSLAAWRRCKSSRCKTASLRFAHSQTTKSIGLITFRLASNTALARPRHRSGPAGTDRQANPLSIGLMASFARRP